MSDHEQKQDAKADAQLVLDCVAGESFAWERFVDRFLPIVGRVVDFSAVEAKRELSPQQRSEITLNVFQELAANDCRQLSKYQKDASPVTFVSILAQRIAQNVLKDKEN